MISVVRRNAIATALLTVIACLTARVALRAWALLRPMLELAAGTAAPRLLFVAFREHRCDLDRSDQVHVHTAYVPGKLRLEFGRRVPG